MIADRKIKHCTKLEKRQQHRKCKNKQAPAFKFQSHNVYYSDGIGHFEK
jgi:hypothetical protein